MLMAMANNRIGSHLTIFNDDVLSYHSSTRSTSLCTSTNCTATTIDAFNDESQNCSYYIRLPDGEKTVTIIKLDD